MARRSANEPPRRGGKPAPRSRHSESGRGVSRHPDSARRTARTPDSDLPRGEAGPRDHSDTPWSKSRRPGSRRAESDNDRAPPRRAESDSRRPGPRRAESDTRRPAPLRAESDRREPNSDARRDRARRSDDDSPRSSSRDRFGATSRRPNTDTAQPGRDTQRQGSSNRWSDRPRTRGGRGGGSHGGAAHEADAEGERLQKVLSRAGLASRREAEDWIRAGRITVNGEPAVLGVRVSPSDQLRLDGRLIRQRETSGGPTAFVCHRSPGESLTQPNSEVPAEGGDAAPSTALIERLPTRAGRRFITISPMPRVDGGLELVTSDGELGVKLQRSVRHLVSQFSVRVLGELSPEQLQNILGGTLDSGEQIEVVSCEPSGGEGANRWYTLVARGASGKEVRQLFERQGAVLSRVQRTHLGPITMERSLGRGQFRELAPEELQALLAAPADES
jgi:23S rRNA pseudouridine2605 synthase